jgi:TonB family protein
MAHVPEYGMFAPLTEKRPPWKEFLASLGFQTVALAGFLYLGLMHPQVLNLPARDYHFIQLVNTPPPVNHQPQPLRILRPPVTAQLVTPRPEALRVPPELRPRIHEPEARAPRVETAEAKPLNMPPASAVIPRELVKTNVFSTGSSATPTIARAPQQVQTGGFGDPNGVPAAPNSGRPITIAQQGSFDLPSGPGYGNGTGGARGVRGVVASAGFGNGVATGDGSGHINTSRGTVRQGGFGDAEPVTPATRSMAAVTSVPKLTPVEIISKPNPLYTEEARQLRVEGEVLLEVTFQSSGTIRVLRVVRGLGHGLDESAIRAAEQIRFKPAQHDGQPADSTAVLHIVFQLA